MMKAETLNEWGIGAKGMSPRDGKSNRTMLLRIGEGRHLPENEMELEAAAPSLAAIRRSGEGPESVGGFLNQIVMVSEF